MWDELHVAALTTIYHVLYTVLYIVFIHILSSTLRTPHSPVSAIMFSLEVNINILL